MGGTFAADGLSLGAVIRVGGVNASEGVSFAIATVGDGIAGIGAGVSPAALTGGGVTGGGDISLVVATATGGFVGCGVGLAATAGDGFGRSTT